jgi:hypothetical protein
MKNSMYGRCRIQVSTILSSNVFMKDQLICSRPIFFVKIPDPLNHFLILAVQLFEPVICNAHISGIFSIFFVLKADL